MVENTFVVGDSELNFGQNAGMFLQHLKLPLNVLILLKTRKNLSLEDSRNELITD